MYVLAAAAAIYVVAAPLAVASYPPITDMPFHAASTSIVRHYFDPAFGFREQFSLHFLEVPYFTMYVVGALIALVAPIALATKITAALFLLLLPAGLGVLFYGMKKSPLLGALALPFVWTTLTHWGFISFMAAIGLFAMAVGAALLVLDRPTPLRRAALGALLVLVFGTHIFRAPFAIAAVIGAAVVMAPSLGRARALALPVLPAAALLAAWLVVRPKELSGAGIGPLHLHFERVAEIPGLLFGAIAGPDEQRLARQSYRIVGGVALACFTLAAGRSEVISTKELRFAARAALVPIAIGAVFFAMFLSLPMQIGVWWYVYPREIVSALFVLTALVPDLPRSTLLRAPLVGAVIYGAVAQASLVKRAFAEFDASLPDFQRVTAQIPSAPRLGYIVWDRDHPRLLAHPYIHLPAWVQAEKGGSLSFHFVSWNATPIRYREGSPDVPPKTPPRFEWTPERFDLKTRGQFFDWILVRRAAGADPRFAKEPEFRLVDHAGAWWLYHRDAPASLAK